VVIAEQCYHNLSEVRLIFSGCIVADTAPFRALVTNPQEKTLEGTYCTSTPDFHGACR
jgi:hypothetical protein